jgi:hypothetical protein
MESLTLNESQVALGPAPSPNEDIPTLLLRYLTGVEERLLALPLRPSTRRHNYFFGHCA